MSAGSTKCSVFITCFYQSHIQPFFKLHGSATSLSPVESSWPLEAAGRALQLMSTLEGEGFQPSFSFPAARRTPRAGGGLLHDSWDGRGHGIGLWIWDA